MSSDRQHPIWDIFEGKIPSPPCDSAVGFKFIEINRDLGKLTVEFDAKPEFTNPLGNVSGGFLSAMMDSLISAAITATLQTNEASPTLELKTNFLKSAKIGKIKGIGQVIHRSRSIAFAEGELFNSDGELIAKASMTSRIIRTDQEELRQRLKTSSNRV